MNSTQPAKVIVVCRQAADDLLPEHEAGYFCRMCGKELQVSPKGRRQIADGGMPTCNPCGLAVAAKHQPEAIQLNPAAKQSLGIPSFPRSDRSPIESLGTFIERMPSGKLGMVEEIGARSIPERPQWLVCDCCCERRDRLWYWKHYGFCTKIPGYQKREFMAGAWSFCVYCKPLMSERRLLVARVASLNPDLEAAVIDQTYEIMLRCLYGDVHEWKSGKPLSGLEGHAHE